MYKLNSAAKILQHFALIAAGFVLFAGLLPSAFSQANQPLNAIHQQVFDHVKQNLDQQLREPVINVRPLPDTLQLPYCPHPLDISQRETQQRVGRLTVSVACPQPSWRVFISVEVDGKLPAVISAKGILRQAVIMPDDVELTLLPANQLRRGTLTNIDEVIGKRAKRAIGPNRMITVQMLDIPYWVNEREEVTLITRVAGLEIKTTGTAMENGIHQDMIEVRNNNSKIIVKGIVIAPNTVWVP
ncbi:MAG: flagellar basal body P-ring formation chaperone FlgA [Thiomicrospira sp.]|jgi:flagella basal body P-ring formation protein FlgA|nr:flagellar basal body P-ring formation chaperone FlgA [Thiomicrospira sp.]